MKSKSKIVFILLFLALSCTVSAQTNSFNESLAVIMRDAPNQFKNIKGKIISNSQFSIVWDCGIKIPGTIASRFVYAKGTFYEGALLQTSDIKDIGAVYQHYINLLDSSLSPLGYTRSESDNFFSGLELYKKVAFLPTIKPGTHIENAPPHLALEVTGSKEKGQYTVVLFIYEH